MLGMVLEGSIETVALILGESARTGPGPLVVVEGVSVAVLMLLSATDGRGNGAGSEAVASGEATVAGEVMRVVSGGGFGVVF